MRTRIGRGDPVRDSDPSHHTCQGERPLTRRTVYLSFSVEGRLPPLTLWLGDPWDRVRGRGRGLRVEVLQSPPLEVPKTRRHHVYDVVVDTTLLRVHLRCTWTPYFQERSGCPMTRSTAEVPGQGDVQGSRQRGRERTSPTLNTKGPLRLRFWERGLRDGPIVRERNLTKGMLGVLLCHSGPPFKDKCRPL